MKMDLITAFFTFTMLWKLSSSLQCYTCQGENTVIAPSCGTFDYNDPRYLKECSTSTMCFKRITTLDFGNGLTSTTIHRGCAQQTDDEEQEKIDGKWQYVTHVREVYQEGCTEDPNDSERSTKTLHCYCRGDLCNQSAVTTGSVLVLLGMAVVILVIS